MAAKIEKIYQVTLTGEKEVVNGMTSLNRAFDDAKRKFLELKQAMSGTFADASEFERIKKAFVDAEKEMLRLQTANQRMKAEVEALSNAQNRQNAMNTTNAQGNRVLSNSFEDVTARVKELRNAASSDNTWRTYSTSIEDNSRKLVDLQLKLQATNNSIKATKKEMSLFAAMGEKGQAELSNLTVQLTEQVRKQAELRQGISQTNIELRNQIKESMAAKGSMDEMSQTLGLMRRLYRSLNEEGRDSDAGKQLLEQINQLDEALKLADASMGNYQRNVGNYTNSIIAAFQSAGMENLITAHIEKASQKVSDLDKEFANLKQQLDQINATGGAGFERIEQQMIQNRQQAGQLRDEISRVNSQLSGMGDVGSRSIGILGRGFDSLRSRLTNLVLGFVGLQAVMSRVTAGISEGLRTAKDIAGVEQAFRRLNDPNLLNNLREATKGTVSDLELMKAVVNADNFGIPVQQMATFLEFAKQRADDTGQSVDYLVNSIVTGIGRKSPMILDNLGISAVRLRKELGGVSGENATIGKVAEAVSRIIQEENEKVGKSIDTVKTKVEQSETNWANLRTELAGKALPVLAEVNAILFSIVSVILGIPFPFWIAGLTALTAAYVAANSEMILSKFNAIQDSIAKNRATVSTNLLAAANNTLSSSLRVVAAGFRTLFAVIRANPLTALVVIAAGLLLWISRIVSKNEEMRKSFASVSLVIEKITGIFTSLFGTISSRLVPILDRLITMFLVPLIEKVIPPLVFQLRLLAGTLNVVAGEFMNALRTGVEFAKGFITIWEGIKNMDAKMLMQGIKDQAKAIEDGFKGTGERIKKNFWEGFNLDSPVVDIVKNKEIEKEKEIVPKELKDIFSGIDQERDRLLAIQKQKRLKDEIDEETYLRNIERINQEAITRKLSYIKGKNAEEKKLAEEFRAERLQIEKDTNDQIFDLRKNEADRLLAERQREAQNQLDDVTSSPLTTNVQREQAEQEYYTTLLNLQREYNAEMDRLEKEFSQNSIESETERKNAIEDLNRELRKNTFELTEAMYEESLDIINRAKERAINVANLEYETKRIQVLRNQNISSREREIELDRIYLENKISEINAEIEAQKKLILVYTQRYGLSAFMRDETIKAMAEIKRLEGDLEEFLRKYKSLNIKSLIAPSEQNTQDVLKEGLMKSLGLNEDSEYGDLIGYALANSFDVAIEAMNNYFSAEEQRIQRSKELAYERIELEKQQLLAQARSQNERDAIEKQAEQKKRQADKEAGERLKKIKKQEAAIAYATELANIAAAAAANPLNGVTLGAAGIAMYSLLAGLATVRYAMNLSTINKTKFGGGGFFKRMFGGGGRLDGPSHSDNNGMPVLNPKTGDVQAYLEGGEGIINKRSMSDPGVYSVTGTISQIASKINEHGGGVDFMGGAIMRKYYADGGYIGSQVQPPVFNSYYDRANQSLQSREQSDRIVRIEEMIQSTNEVLSREVNRKTVVSIHDINDTQDESRKQSEIATL